MLAFEGCFEDFVFVPFGAACEAYSIRPYDWVRAILQNIDAIPQLGTCCPSKNCPVFVPFGVAYWAYPIRLYNWVRVWVQKMDLYFLPSVASGEHMQYAPTTGYMQSFKIPMQFPNRIRVVLLKNCPVFVHFGTACGAYAIRPYGRVRAIL